jgi:hypothetical protein
MTGIDRIVAGRIELPVGFVSDSDVIETPICNQMKRVVRYRDSCVLIPVMRLLVMPMQPDFTPV